ncbi:MAG: enoyl-CoA hydratase/isomerase family protein [Acidimicrobiales bacterium]
MTTVAFEISNRVCHLRLSRPEKLNALNEAVREELHAHLSTLTDRPDVSVLVVSGEGRAFSAGADLATMPATPAASWAQRRHEAGGWQRLLELLEAVPQVTVASIQGYCIGGAALLGVACDLRIAAADVHVQIPELDIGIPLTWSGVPRLAREVGLPMARDLVMTGRTLNGEAALACGFVQRLVAVGELAAATDSLVAQLLAMSEAPLAMTRSMFSAISRDQSGAAGWADADLLAWSLAEGESREAAANYRRKRLAQGGGSSPG